jgi:DNA invertase Pin-like site-specific DNA recombinase
MQQNLRVCSDTWVNMSGQVVAYRRVSTADQSTLRQLDGETYDVLFEDQASGKDIQRPELTRMLAHVRKGDIVLVHSMDRLARNVDDLRRVVAELTKKGVSVRFVKECLTFTADSNPIAEMMLSIIGAVAQFERSMILERQREGIAVAKAAGAFKGGKAKLSGARAAELRARCNAGEPKAKLARAFGVTRETVYQYISGWCVVLLFICIRCNRRGQA